MTSKRASRLAGPAAPAALLAALIAGCGTGTVPATDSPAASPLAATPTADGPSQRPAQAASVSPPSSDAPSVSSEPDPLAGTWTTGRVSCDQWDGAIAKVYKPAEIAKYDKDPNTHQCPSTFTLRFAGRHMLIFVDDELGWDGPYRFTGPDTFESGDVCDFCWSYRFHVTGDRLVIDLVKDGDPVDPLLDGIVQTGIFESVPYSREA